MGWEMNGGQSHSLYIPIFYIQILMASCFQVPGLMQLPELTPIWDPKRLRRQHKRPYPDLAINQGSTVAKP